MLSVCAISIVYNLPPVEFFKGMVIVCIMTLLILLLGKLLEKTEQRANEDSVFREVSYAELSTL